MFKRWGLVENLKESDINFKLENFIICLKCEVSGKPCDLNCPIQYNAGNMGEIIDYLNIILEERKQKNV